MAISKSIWSTLQPAQNMGNLLSNPTFDCFAGMLEGQVRFQGARLEIPSPTQVACGWLAGFELSSLFALKRTNTSLVKSHLRQDGSKVTVPAVSKERISKERPASEINTGNKS